MKPTWRRLWTEYLDYHMTSVHEAVYACTFALLLADDPRDLTCLLAEMNGKVIGLTHHLSQRHT